MAAVVGALSPLIVGGSALGIWKYVQFRKQGPKFERAPSDMTDDSYEEVRNRKGFNKNGGKITPSSERRDSESDTYARPYSNPLSLSGDSEYSFEDAHLNTPMSDMDNDVTQSKWGPASRPLPPSVSGQSRGVYNNPAGKSDAINSWMF